MIVVIVLVSVILVFSCTQPIGSIGIINGMVLFYSYTVEYFSVPNKIGYIYPVCRVTDTIVRYCCTVIVGKQIAPSRGGVGVINKNHPAFKAGWKCTRKIYYTCFLSRCYLLWIYSTIKYTFCRGKM